MHLLMSRIIMGQFVEDPNADTRQRSNKNNVLIRHIWVKKPESAAATGNNDSRHRRPLQTAACYFEANLLRSSQAVR